MNLALLAAIVAAIGGVVGSVLVPVLGSNLTTAVQAVLQALSGLLVAIPTYHASAVAAETAKAKLARVAKPKALVK